MLLANQRSLVSVITPTFNRARFLEETIASIRNQTKRPLEHLIIDDGSTDDTPIVVAKLQRQTSDEPEYELLYHRQSKSGEAAAVNAGWLCARGDFVSIVNSDDPQPHDWLQACVSTLESTAQAVFAYPNWIVIDGSGQRVAEVVLPDFSYQLLFGLHRNLPGPGVVVRRQCVPEGPIFREHLKHTSDYDAWLRLSILGPVVRAVDATAQWRDHQNSKSHENVREAAAEYRSVVREFFEKDDLPRDVRRLRTTALGYSAYQCARILIRHHPIAAAGWLSKAFCRLAPLGKFPVAHSLKAGAKFLLPWPSKGP